MILFGVCCLRASLKNCSICSSTIYSYLLPARASEQGKEIGLVSVSVYIYIYLFIYFNGLLLLFAPSVVTSKLRCIRPTKLLLLKLNFTIGLFQF